MGNSAETRVATEVGGGARGRLTRRRAAVTAAGAAGSGWLAAACGGPPAGAPGAGGAAGEKPSGTPEFWQWAPIYNDGFKELIGEFNARSGGVTVGFPGATEAYWDKLTAALAGNTGPDLFLMNGVNALAWAHRKQVRDLSDLHRRDRDAAGDLKAVVRAFGEFYQGGGALMGWPWDFSASVTAYNVNHIKEAGLKTPAELGEGWDWNALAEHARRLNQPGQRWGVFANSNVQTGWLNYVAGNGGAFLSPDRTACTISSAPALEATQFLVDLIHKQRVAPTSREVADMGDETEGFIAGKLSMGTFGDWKFSDFTKKSQGVTWDVTYIAKSPAQKRTGNMANFRGLVMNPASKQVEAGWAFMKHMLTRPVQDRIPRLFSEAPARQDSVDEVYASAERAGPPAGRAWLKQSIRATQPLPAHNVATWAELVAVFDPLLAEMFENRVAVRDGLARMQDGVNALFARSGR